MLVKSHRAGFRTACTRMGSGNRWVCPGSALDNAVTSRGTPPWSSNCGSLEHFATRAQARARVAAWIDEYNRDRRHSALQMRSPIGYELALDSNPEAA